MDLQESRSPDLTSFTGIGVGPMLDYFDHIELIFFMIETSLKTIDDPKPSGLLDEWQKL